MCSMAKEPAIADVGVNVPPGSYEVLRRDLTGTTRAVIDGHDTLTEAELKRFRVRLEPQDANILLVQRAGP